MSPAAPLRAVKNLVSTHPVGTTLAVGAVTHGAFATAMLGIEWPEGDPGKLRTAAYILDDLARKIDEGVVVADEAAMRVWLENAGPGIDEFRKMWQGVPSGPSGPLGYQDPAQGFSGYPPQIASYCRRVAEGCRAYAGCIETIRHVLMVLAAQAWVNMLFTTMFGWTTAGLANTVQEKIMEKYFRQLAQSQLKIFRISIEKIVFSFFYYAADSVVYAGIQQGLRAGIFAATGVRKDLEGSDVLSAKTNAIQFAQALGANAAYNGVWDLSKVLKYAPRGTRWGDFVSRLSGSATYSVVDNFEQDPTENPVPTDWQTWVSKIFTHGVRSIRPS